MNKYLLLRDNKQSGPYTADELATKGLKAYDLIWQEGKSAAWRYPSEINELKSFAPVVEEQPYDRFYKKPSANDNAEKPVNGFTTNIQEQVPIKQVAATNFTSTSSGKISVTLPGNNRTTFVPSVKQAAAAVPVTAKVNESEPVQTVNSFPSDDVYDNHKEEVLIRSYPDRSTEHSMVFAESHNQPYEVSVARSVRPLISSFKRASKPSERSSVANLRA